VTVVRIGIDARFLTHPQRGGFKTYTVNLVAALASIDSPHSFVVYTDREASLAPIEQPRFSVRCVDGRWPLVGLPWREQVRLPRQASRDRLDLLHSLAQTAPAWPGCPLIVTIHDTFSLDRRQYPGRARSAHDQLLSFYLSRAGLHAARNAAHILTVSSASKADLVRRLDLDAGRISVVHEAPAPAYRQMDRQKAADEVARRFGLFRRFILHVGSPDGRKNTGTLLQPSQSRGRAASTWRRGNCPAEQVPGVVFLGESARTSC
jgi:hypothetical protein